MKRAASADGCTHIMNPLYLFRPVRSTGENNAHERENSLDIACVQFFPPTHREQMPILYSVLNPIEWLNIPVVYIYLVPETG